MSDFCDDMIRIAIADDRPKNLVALLEQLNNAQNIKVCFTCKNGQEFMEKLKNTAHHQLPEIVLMDIDMPEKNGIETVRDAKTLYPQIEFLMLTVFDEYEKIFEAVKAGASGYLLKDESAETIINFIHQVKEFRAVPMSPAIARKTLRLLCDNTSENDGLAQQDYELTPREKKVLRLLVDGLEYKEIADKLNVSPHTVRNQLSSVYHKLHVKGKVDAVKLAIKNKIV